MVTIIVFSNIKIYCDGLSNALSNTNSFDVIGTENNFKDAIPHLRQDSPDVILLDMTMVDSCIIAQEVMKFCPDSKIVALSVPEDERNIIQCAEVGIASYVAREASLSELIEIVLGTLRGEFYCPPKIAACIFRKIQSLALNTKETYQQDSNHNSTSICAELTRREKEIAALITDGLSNKLIARDMNIEVSTVKNHVHNILVKLEVKNRTQIVSLLQRNLSSERYRSQGLDISV